MFNIFYLPPVLVGHYSRQLKAKYVFYHHQYSLTLKETFKETGLGEFYDPIQSFSTLPV